MRMHTTPMIAAAAIIALFVAIPKSEAKPEYSKKEKTSCVTCHVSAKSKELNEKGKHYKEHKTLPK